MTKLKLTTALFSLAVIASPALAQEYVDAKIQELFSQGYTHFEVSRGLLRTEIDAYGPNFTKLEVQLSNADGSVVSERTQIESQAEYSENVREISQTNTNIREELDDDRREAHSEGVNDDLYDDETDDRYEGVNDDRYEGVDDDRDENDANDREDDHGIGGYESPDDGRYDDHDDDRTGDRDDDGHDSDGHDGDDD